MIFSKTHNFVFIHIAKNGGTSIDTVLRKYGVEGMKRSHFNEALSMLPYKRSPENMVHPPHVDARWVRTRVGPKVYDNMFSFAIVRNPFDQMVSRYEYIRKNTRHHSHKTATRLGFDEFMRYQKWNNWNFTKTQYAKITDSSGKVIVSKVYRFESFHEVLPDVTSIIGVDAPSVVPHANASERKPYQNYYDDSARKFVEVNFRKDLEYFGYSFNG